MLRRSLGAVIILADRRRAKLETGVTNMQATGIWRLGLATIFVVTAGVPAGALPG